MSDAIVLLVEDNPAEQHLARRSLEKSRLNVDLRTVSDGEEALDYLFRRGVYSDSELSPKPDIILLDLNLPKIDGREVLRKIKTSPHLVKIPVIVLTTSKKDEDVIRTYELGCNSFLNKPVDFQDFITTLKQVSAYWLNLVVLPPKEDE